MEKYPFNAVVFTSDVASHLLPFGEYADFVIDLDTIVVPKNPCIVDYNHYEDDVIGTAEITVVDHQIIAEGELVSARPDDRAASIAAMGREVPFGISPTLDLEAGKRIDVASGETFTANGREYVGPLYIYQNAVLLGISVCPYPTDGNTSFTPLKKGRLVTMSKNTKFNIGTGDNPNNDAGLNNDDAKKPSDVKNKELQEYIDRFGTERGVEYYQNDVPMDEAVAQTLDDVLAENEELKARLARFEADVAQGGRQDDDQSNAQSADDTELSRVLQRLERRIAKFEATAAQERRAIRRGDSIGLSASRDCAKKVGYKDAFRAALK